MKFTFTCKKIALNDSIKDYAEKKISKLDRYFPEEADAFVTFAVEKKNRCVVELTIRAANGTLFRAQEEDPDGDMRAPLTRPLPLSTAVSARTRPVWPGICGPMPWRPPFLPSLTWWRSRNLTWCAPSASP